MKKLSAILGLLTVGSALLMLTACKEDEYRLVFSHYVHVTDNGMECSDCHGDVDLNAPADISHESCADCHDETEADEINKQTCGLCHERKLLPGLEDWEAKPTPRRGIFIHTEALADRCEECHGPVLSEQGSVVPRLKRDDVLRMRDLAHASAQDCETCHADMDRYERPPNHDIHWMQRHRLFGTQQDAACSVCHSEDSCRECHSVMQPVSHNNMWRLNTHGIEAAWDRERCMVCHEEDSCMSCHAQVQPRSHGPLWEQRHGTWEPGRCMVCHEPDTCNACHSQNSPRSHRASWDDRHCTACHISEGDSCVVCHEAGSNKAELHQDSWPSFHDGYNNQTDCLQCH